ncbi:hypothetical protein [Micromonospora inositola]|uniref:hypothetical protein n=1 Tax=Micromonospora inositola TaxID=47865 RepID=UPI0018D4E67C|nr:hypothetical protein [Micromonospora inositola]
MQRFDSVGCDLVVGTAVRATVMSHEPWGVMAEVLGHETVGASVDAGVIDSPSGAPRALPEEYPPVGEQVDAVVQEISRYHPPVWIRLTMRAADLHKFSWPCGCCGQLTILSPGGDGVTVDVRSSEDRDVRRSPRTGPVWPTASTRTSTATGHGLTPWDATNRRPQRSEPITLIAAPTAGCTLTDARVTRTHMPRSARMSQVSWQTRVAHQSTEDNR